ncbi:SLBB domain-containing protein [Polaribacter tangerinus]|uniref:SLBB domain-containing protein n=1 Tax=Polaribacter tangerinus TaxID=1920034 RepID=UPI000B4B2D2A|nr:SLBB domain-containing protein [Polaribacter tangerinus]
MKKTVQLLFVIFIALQTSVVFAQDIKQLNSVDVNGLTDAQIETYWQQIKKRGYSLEQLDVLGKAQGISPSKIAAFKRRVNNLSFSSTNQDADTTQLNEMSAKENDAYGLSGDKTELLKAPKDKELLFGYDFFSNSKISFTPSVNLAVPENYQIGPGDELMIDLWGASEVTYKSLVNTNGNIKISGIGFIYVNGFSLEDATKKIITKLKKKHAGIAASNSSYNKVYTNITVSKIRTVQVNIIGEVKTPGTYSLNSLATVLNALYVAGGPTKMGTFRDVQLIRGNTKIASLDIYEYMISGMQQGNLKLQDQDVLLVKPYKNRVTVEGAVKRPGIYELKDHETLADLVNYFGGFKPEAYTNLFVIERLNGTQKEVREVALSAISDFKMQSGDKLVVNEVLDRFQNKITIEGEVYRPGNYELFENMTLQNLLQKAEGVTPEAFLQRGLLVRTFDASKKQNIPFSIASVLEGKSPILLRAKDSIKIFNKNELREKRTITVNGEVNNPGTFNYIDDLQIEDVIAMSGGLKEGADEEVISVSRRLKDGSFVTLSEIYAVSSDKNLAINKGTPFYLQPYDVITVRTAKGYISQKNVKITGEVKYQGTYTLKNKNERISDLIERAGGFTEFAYVEGAVLIRKTETDVAKDIKDVIKKNEGEVSDLEILEEEESTLDEYKVAIDLGAILKNKNSDIDMFLRENDELIIPSERQTVKVSGMVIKPSLVQYKKGRRLKEYITKSGGFADMSKRSKVYVSYANGDVETVKNFLFFRWYPKLSPGATIYVPAKPERKKMSAGEIMGITSSIATLGILIQTLLR